jgi:hypothetical protein
MLLEVPPLDRMPYFQNDDSRGDATQKVNNLFVSHNADWTSELNIRLPIILTYKLFQRLSAPHLHMALQTSPVLIGKRVLGFALTRKTTIYGGTVVI